MALSIILTTVAFTAAAQPGQAILLGKVMSVLDSPNMVERGDFISLMFFVLALGVFVVYFNLGWSANVVAQVSNRRKSTTVQV
jgi:ATP-binding cassette, subfamily B (MDR/TAP), member 1